MEKSFLREIYLRATPSIDLDEVSTDNPIEPSDYTIKDSDFQEVLKEFCDPTSEDRIGYFFLMLDRGPKLIND